MHVVRDAHGHGVDALAHLVEHLAEVGVTLGLGEPLVAGGVERAARRRRKWRPRRRGGGRRRCRSRLCLHADAGEGDPLAGRLRLRRFHSSGKTPTGGSLRGGFPGSPAPAPAATKYPIPIVAEVFKNLRRSCFCDMAGTPLAGSAKNGRERVPLYHAAPGRSKPPRESHTNRRTSSRLPPPLRVESCNGVMGRVRSTSQCWITFAKTRKEG